MLLPELKLDILRRRPYSRLTDLPSRHIRPTEIHSDLRVARILQAGHIRLVNEAVTHGREKPLEIRPPEIRLTSQLRERVEDLPHGVQVDIRGSVIVETLREIRVDAQELCTALVGGSGGGLGFEGGEEGLEPFERRGILADPDELDTAETTGRIRPGAQVPDVFEDGGPGRDAYAGAD